MKDRRREDLLDVTESSETATSLPSFVRNDPDYRAGLLPTVPRLLADLYAVHGEYLTWSEAELSGHGRSWEAESIDMLTQGIIIASRLADSTSHSTLMLFALNPTEKVLRNNKSADTDIRRRWRQGADSLWKGRTRRIALKGDEGVLWYEYYRDGEG